MSRHKIIINEGFHWDENEFNEPSPKFWADLQKNLRQSVSKNVVQPRSKSTFSLPILNMPPISSNNTELFDSWIESYPKFNNYPKNEKKYDHVTDLDTERFKKFLYSNDFITLNEDKSKLIECLNDAVEQEDMVVELNFLKVSKKLFANKKKFMKKIGNELVYYWDTTTPSVIDCKSSTTITNYAVYDPRTKQSYMELHYYNELGVLVRYIRNPTPEKIVPAIVVTDLNKQTLEVHCYYKNQYISPEMIKEMKPNLIKENFTSSNYFDKRDINFLDMVMI